MKTIVLLLLAGIIVSLGSGLFYLIGDNRDSAKVLKALKIRVTLSLILILFLVGSFLFGWLEPPG
jgi:succinate dehydrogenase hydrophobic anchor subunit